MEDLSIKIVHQQHYHGVICNENPHEWCPNVKNLVGLGASFKHCGIIEYLSKELVKLGTAKVVVFKENAFQLLYKKKNEQLQVKCHF